VDDLGAVLVIAIFYSDSLRWSLIGIGLLLLAVMFFLSYRKIYAKGLVLVIGVIIWFLFLKAGIHPTIAGVLMAFTIPIRQKIDVDTYVNRLCDMVDHIKSTENRETPLLSKNQIEEIDNLEDWTGQVQSPLQHLEHRLHNWVAFMIIPLFALSNSAVELGSGMELDLRLGGMIMISLVVGKLLGISIMSWIGLKTGLAELPEGVNFPQIIGVALLAGVGFTMSIFVANLAFFDQPHLLDSAKVGILAGSFVAGLGGYIVLRFTGRKTDHD